MRLQLTIAAMIRLRRLNRSTSRPMGRPISEYNRPKASPSKRLICRSEICRSCLIGVTSREIANRSRIEIR